MAGRPSLPTNIKILRGTQKPSRINPNEPDPEIGIPSCPADLSSTAKAEWYRITPLLEELGLIADINRSALAQYCQMYGRWIKAEREIAKTSEVVMDTIFSKSGNPIKVQRKNPWVDIAMQSIQECRRLMVEFGLTPASQAKVNGKKKESPKENKAERFFKS